EDMNRLVSQVTFSDNGGGSTSFSSNLNNIFNGASNNSNMNVNSTLSPQDTVLVASNSRNITFTDEETQIPASIAKQISDYVEKLFEAHNRMTQVYHLAIDQFDTTMKYYSNPVTISYNSMVDILLAGVSMLITSTSPVGIFVALGAVL